MANKMLIDASHPEETRVVVLRGNRVEEFDFESANRKQLRGNIYLAKVTRVEPSLQAAFVDYGGNRHGFLAFSEIHPDYYQIPVADRQALIAAQEREHRDAEAEHENRSRRRGGGRHRSRGARRPEETMRSDAQPLEGVSAEEMAREAAEIPAGDTAQGEQFGGQSGEQTERTEFAMPPAEPTAAELSAENVEREALERPAGEAPPDSAERDHGRQEHHGEEHATAAPPAEGENGHSENGHGEDHHEDEHVESVGGADAMEEAQERAPRVRPRQYKIQEVIKRRQVMLVQVVKEERGTKGAALTTYLSLAGRFSVLMPNTARGGGISRKITSSEDRSRLKEIAQELEVPEGMGVILRTAGAARTKAEVKRDFEYLLRVWETVRDLPLKSTAPKLTYEEGSLTKRAIRDLYTKDIDEVVVAGEEGYKEAKDFMRMLMPSHAKNIKLYRDSQPVFTRYGIESQLDAMFTPTVQLRSGGYIVINQAEALVAIDVNSGRATREHHIEDTALKTNCEAADEVARQLRLRDLAGLIVIDFIDMDEGRNNRTVERRLKEALKHDRARIQVGRISHFGLMEMSRQRIRSSVLESSTEKCPVCGGSGHVRSVSSVTLALLRAIEENMIKSATHNLTVRTRPEVALYILNQKRGHLRALEERFRITITVNADPTVMGAQPFMIDRGEQVHTAEAARAIAAASEVRAPLIEEDEDELLAITADEAEEETGVETFGEPAEAAVETVPEHDREHPDHVAPSAEGDRDQSPGRRRRRRGGRGRGRGDEGRDGRGGEGRGPRERNTFASETNETQPGEHAGQFSGEQLYDRAEGATADTTHAPDQGGAQAGATGGENGDGKRRRRRGRRGGRRNRGRNGDNNLRPQDGGNGEHEPITQDRAPAHEPAAPHRDPDPAPAYAAPVREPAREPARADAAEGPRRKSTIREPAPAAWGGGSSGSPSSAPAVTPVVTSSADASATPKRGWWGRKILGDK